MQPYHVEYLYIIFPYYALYMSVLTNTRHCGCTCMSWQTPGTVDVHVCPDKHQALWMYMYVLTNTRHFVSLSCIIKTLPINNVDVCTVNTLCPIYMSCNYVQDAYADFFIVKTVMACTYLSCNDYIISLVYRYMYMENQILTSVVTEWISTRV